MPIRLSRLLLYVQDVALLKQFYRAHFGFPMVEEIAVEWAVLDAGGIELALHLVGKPWRGMEAGGDQSNAKLVFSIDTGLLELREKLEKAGVEMGPVKRFPGFAYALCDGRDPEGNVFQLSMKDN